MAHPVARALHCALRRQSCGCIHFILTAEELSKFPSFLLSLLDGYIVLYSRDPHSSNEPDDAKRIVRAVREHVLRNGITRVPHKGGYYWKNLPRSTGVTR